MVRYIFLSVFALLLLTACGGNDLVDQFGKNWELRRMGFVRGLPIQT